MVEIHKDYWFIDPANHAPHVDRITFQIVSADPFMKAAYAFQLSAITKLAQFKGSIPIQQDIDGQKVIYEVEQPSDEFFYIFIVEGTSI